ncbi:hypothetical protein [Sutcliffiella horikoshii]|nr:hypothetical protein [Sutcliffiella horikoshii]
MKTLDHYPKSISKASIKIKQDSSLEQLEQLENLILLAVKKGRRL